MDISVKYSDLVELLEVATPSQDKQDSDQAFQSLGKRKISLYDLEKWMDAADKNLKLSDFEGENAGWVSIWPRKLTSMPWFQFFVVKLKE
jgi:hypothetical protein